MKWDADQRTGFFGYTVGTSGAAQPRWMARVDIGHAVEAMAREVRLLRLTYELGGAQAFSGGVMDSWPAWALDALRVGREETRALDLYWQQLQQMTSPQPQRRQRHA